MPAKNLTDYNHGRFVRRWLLVLLTLISPVAARAADSLAAEPPTRNLLPEGEPRFIREWLLLGPVRWFPAGMPELERFREDPLASTGGEAAAHPSPDITQPLPGNLLIRWTSNTSWGDVLDVCGGVRSTEWRGSTAPVEIAYAYATVNRDRAGNALLSVGIDGGCRIWVNGTLVRDEPGPELFSFDDVRIPVVLDQGENRILVKTTHTSGPWRLALRMLEAGTVLTKIDEIVPSIEQATSGTLHVRTDKHEGSGGAPVRVDVVKAGGKVIAHTTASRGRVVKFTYSSWPDGAYEIRCSTKTAWGMSFTRYLKWYKGNAVSEARRLIEAARNAKDDVRGGTIRMLAEMVLDRAGGNFEELPDDGWHRIHSPLLEFEELEMARTNPSAVIHAGGFVRIAYRDETDGSIQFCRGYLPPDYTPTKRWPLVVSLHGYNPPNPVYVRWWSVDERHNEVADTRHVIYIEPHGRGNTQYSGIGENDVLHCIDEAKRRFNVDPDRVYLTGESMGGGGTWRIASRHPDVFAAAAPVYGGWDYRVLPGNPAGSNPLANTPPERYAQEIQSSFVSAENLLHVPMFVHHGDADKSVNVEFSRHATRMLQRWGYDIRYDELPGWGHEDLKLRGKITDWLLEHRRVNAPRVVRLRAPDLSAASAYWVRVEERENPFQMIRVRAEAVEPGVIQLTTNNVTSMTLSPPQVLTGGKKKIRVVWNGNTQEVTLPRIGGVTIAAGEEGAQALRKRPGLDGGLSDFIATPFALVVGTCSEDSVMRNRCREKAEAFAELWDEWEHCRPRIFADSEITAAQEKQFSLLLIGGSDANLVTRRIGASLPLHVDGNEITIDGRKFPATDAVVQMLYPSPFNRDRYVEVVAGTSAAGLYFWNPLHWNSNLGYQTLIDDWIIRDGRRVKLGNGLGPEHGWVASGAFDGRWRLDDRWVLPGDSALRAGSPLRHPAPPGYVPDPEFQKTCVGRYAFGPGIFATVSEKGNRLVVSPPFGALPLELVPEGGNEFAEQRTCAPVVFEQDAQGSISGMMVDIDGQEIRGRKE